MDSVEQQIKDLLSLDRNLLEKLLRPVAELNDIPERTRKPLLKNHVIYVGDSVVEQDHFFLGDGVSHFGRTMLGELKSSLKNMELFVGMSIPFWPNKRNEFHDQIIMGLQQALRLEREPTKIVHPLPRRNVPSNYMTPREMAMERRLRHAFRGNEFKPR